ncbi:MAG: GntR family transcriptional regulator [Defluviitaleaceae bacterium]|nr:GntR family transcriptional regulator [Defluviitaleaceae bacterium]
MPHPNTWHNQFDERSPIYEQIILQFCRSLIKGELAPAERIPSIRDLAIALKVNTNTVQRAYQEMERKQLIYSKRGTGYFITEGQDMVNEIKAEMVKETVSRFVAEMRSLGFGEDQIKGELSNYMEEGDGHADN